MFPPFFPEPLLFLFLGFVFTVNDAAANIIPNTSPKAAGRRGFKKVAAAVPTAYIYRKGTIMKMDVIITKLHGLYYRFTPAFPDIFSGNRQRHFSA